ncbi:MAG: hypothetical protein H6Q74_1534 [Firmicutes bacterium]|nr:hypothetical protein [Bacillota bacterium]
MLIAVEYLGEVGIGVTAPHFFRADDGKVYVVKFKTNRLGPTVLVNEFIAAQLGNIIGLCFPLSDVILLTDSLISKTPQLISIGVNAGQHFASQYLTNTKHLDKNNLSLAINIKELAGILLFDHMFHDLDHFANKNNFLLHREEVGWRIYVIDNSHLFKSGRWTLQVLDKLANNKKIYYRHLFKVLLNDCLVPSDFVPYLERVKGLSDIAITAITDGIPAEWLTEEGEREALAHHISLRRDIAEQLWHRLCRHIPLVHGGQRSSAARIIRSTEKSKI